MTRVRGFTQKPAFELWTKRHEKRAMEEGWVLSHNKDRNRYEIQKLDESEHFPTDMDAVDFVWNEATNGSHFHILAVYLDQRRTDSDTYVPEPIFEKSTPDPQTREEIVAEITADLAKVSDDLLGALHEHWKGMISEHGHSGP